MIKVIFMVLALGVFSVNVSAIEKIKVLEIDGRVNPISVYEVCIKGVKYFVLVSGYKAGMSVEFESIDGKAVVKQCKKDKKVKN